MNWLSGLPGWMSYPILQCFGPTAVEDAGVWPPAQAAAGPQQTFWWILLAAMLLGLAGTYLGAWAGNARVKVAGYVGSALLIIAFLAVTPLAVRGVLDVANMPVMGDYYLWLGGFSVWLALSLPLLLLAVALNRWVGRDAGRIGSSVFSEYLSFLCICWLFLSYALNHCA